jgi:ParB family transcriptional regulator, chromosome partitioning protein
MNLPAGSKPAAPKRGAIIGLQERRLGRNILRTRPSKLDIDDLVPNENQPRMGPKEDVELQRQIVANEGVFEPLLVEPHPELDGKFRIIDGDRRWTNTKILVEQGKQALRTLPVEITDRTLEEEERLRVWIYIHRQRKEWDAREKEMVAYRLVDIVGRASGANILGITVRELDKLVDVYQLSGRFTALREPAAAITWARELNGVAKKLLTPTVVDAIVKKVNDKRITNSKDLRKLRQILRDPVARQHFLSREGDIDSALLRVSGPAAKSAGLGNDIAGLTEAVSKYAWTELQKLKGDSELLETIDRAQEVLASLRNALEK